jgi:hypothetical protein
MARWVRPDASTLSYTTRRFHPLLLVLPLPRPGLRCPGGAWWGRVHVAASESVADQNSSHNAMYVVWDYDDRVSSAAETGLGSTGRDDPSRTESPQPAVYGGS